MSNKKRVYISEDMKWVAIKKHILEDATIEELAQELGITTGPLNTYLRKNNIAPNSKCMKAGEKHKWCSSCRLFHKKVQFNKGKGYCKEVESSMKAEYYIKHKRNLDYASKQLALSDKGKLQNLKAQLKKHYGITPEDRRDIMDSQKGCCAICGKSLVSPVYSKNNMHVDHDHKTGKVRGLLCGCCNKAIGLLQDSSSYCRNAANYLEI